MVKFLYNTVEGQNIILHFNLSKLGQILCVDRTGLLRPGYNHYRWCAKPNLIYARLGLIVCISKKLL